MESESTQLCDDLLALLASLKAAMAEAADKHNLTMPQLFALYAVSRGEGTMGHLAAALHCDASNVTGIVDRLGMQKLVTSGPAPHDRRAKVLALTPAGQQLIDEVSADLPTKLGCMRLSKAESSELHALLLKLNEE